jgi:hypothetical protein
MSKESKHVAKFRASHLKTGEAIKAFDDGYIGEAMGSGSKRQYNGSLIVTNERVAFYRKGLLGEVLETIPLKSITSIERKSLLGHRTIGIHTSHDALVFKTFNKDGETTLIDAIEDGRHSSNANNVTQAKQESPLEQLKRLGELKEAGVITDEEFSSKKAELLEKI